MWRRSGEWNGKEECVETERSVEMKKKKTSIKTVKKEEQPPNSSPVCYADSKDLRPEYKDEQTKPAKKKM